MQSDLLLGDQMYHLTLRLFSTPTVRTRGTTQHIRKQQTLYVIMKIKGADNQ
jgi:hypothetical protein